MSPSPGPTEWLSVLHSLEKLVDVSKNQQNFFAAKDFSALADSFQMREELVNEICHAWHEINDNLGKSDGNKVEFADELQTRVHELINEFFKSDQYVQVLMNYQMENILIELGRRKNVQVVIEQYKQVERITDVVSRTFKNGPRYFDRDY